MEAPDGPKSGCRCLEAPPIEVIHAPLPALTGSLEMSKCHALSEGNTEQDEPGGGTAHAGGSASQSTPAKAAARRWRRIKTSLGASPPLPKGRRGDDRPGGGIGACRGGRRGSGPPEGKRRRGDGFGRRAGGGR